MSPICFSLILLAEIFGAADIVFEIPFEYMLQSSYNLHNFHIMFLFTCKKLSITAFSKIYSCKIGYNSRNFSPLSSDRNHFKVHQIHDRSRGEFHEVLQQEG